MRPAGARADCLAMTPDRDAELLSRFWVLHSAIILRDGLEDRLRSGPPDQELFDRSLAAAEAVIEARGALYAHLIATGWTPPPVVVRDLAYDQVLLDQPGGTVRG